MVISIQRFTGEFAEEWDQLVWTSNNGTMFHTRQFLSYHPEERFCDHSLIFNKKDRPFVLFPAAETETADGKWLVSHPGASFGSLVVPEDLAFADSIQLVERLIEYAHSNDFIGIRLTLPPTIYSRRLSNYVDFALLHQGFDYRKREISSMLFLEDDISLNLAKFRSSHRRAVSKARKCGVSIRMTDDYQTFYTILQKNLKIRHGVKPTHTIAELLKLQQLFPERINLFGAYHDDKMIAGVVNFIANDDVVLAFYMRHDEDYQEYRGVNLLFYSIFDWAISEKYKVFDFGIFTVNEDPNFGLARFKENFGASGMFRDTLELRL